MTPGSNRGNSPRYRTIVADPPWPYEPHGSHVGRAAEGKHPLPYPAMAIEEIKRFPAKRFSALDCRLFLWTTSRYLQAAFSVIDHWGFTYKQALVWHKTGNPSPFTGSVAPTHAEFLLVAVLGKPPVVAKWPTSVIAADKPIRDHSRKPDVFLDLVEQVSSGPYLELFARRQRLGWDTWGNEALEHVEVVA